MYSRSNSSDPRSRDTRIPPNYGGSAFSQRETPVRVTTSRSMMPKQSLERDLPPHRDDRPRTHFTDTFENRPAAEDEYAEQEMCESCERCDDCPMHEEHFSEDDECEERGTSRHDVEPCDQCSEKKEDKKPFSLLSPIGALGTEEILLIALAHIIFQSNKEPELALILLALLFIN